MCHAGGQVSCQDPRWANWTVDGTCRQAPGRWSLDCALVPFSKIFRQWTPRQLHSSQNFNGQLPALSRTGMENASAPALPPLQAFPTAATQYVPR